MFNGLWTVEFTTTINRYGRGVLVINEGRLLGGDNGYYYTGTYNIDGNSFDGEISVIRYDENFISVFGDIGHFQLGFKGIISENEFNAVGNIISSPQVQIEIVGIKREDLQS